MPLFGNGARPVVDDTSNDLGSNMAMNEEELDQIWQWNASVPKSVYRCVHDLISEIAERQPTAPAVDAWDGKFTYFELNTLADKLAHRLVEINGGRASRIPIYFEKSKWTAVAMLAVIKSGSAAIALDHNYPDVRLKAIVDQTEATVMICSRANSQKCSSLADVPSIVLEEGFQDLEINTSNDLPKVSSEDLVYISFTSGTTGAPKGACISHSNVRSAVHYQGLKLGFNKDARVLDFAPYSFDVAWSNFLHTICAGGCLCIAREQDMLSDLSATIDSFECNLINVTPTVLRTIDAIPKYLQTILLSGEMPYRENITKWAGRVRLLNTYGPTECTFKCAFSVISPSQKNRPDLGTGVGFCTWIVDPNNNQKLAPIGSPGELYLEGPLVGQGYLSDLVKTDAAFVTNPLWLTKGSRSIPSRQGRLYKTGDLVKYNSDGKLMFVGRKDGSQLKIRGQRVEIGDVEHHVRTCLQDQLQVIADVIQPEDSSIPALALFVQVSEQKRGHAKELLDKLQKQLPDVLPGFMVPTVYLPVEEFPLGATGKTDRKSLKEMAKRMSSAEMLLLHSSMINRADHQEPRNDIERDIRQIWSEVLNLDSATISITDNLFKIGGDSIAAVRIIAAARRKGLSFTFGDVLSSESLQDLALVAVQEDAANLRSEDLLPFSLLKEQVHPTVVRREAARLCGVDPEEIEDAYPCTPLQEGMLAMTAKKTDDYVLKAAYQLPDDIDLERFRLAWVKTAMQAPILRTRIVNMAGQGLVQVVLNTPAVWRRYEDMIAFEHEEPMGLGTPLCRIGILRDQSNTFVIQLHHAIYDGWSKMLLFDTVENIYLNSPDHQALSPFQPFVKHVMASSSPKATEFWQTQLAGHDGSPFPPLQTVQGPKLDLNFCISDVHWPKTAISQSTIIRTALTLLLAIYTDSQDVVFGATMSGRQAGIVGIDRMPGPTISTTPVCVDFQWSQTIAELQKQIQKQMVEIAEYEQLGLQAIQRIDGNENGAGQFNLLLIVQPKLDGTSQTATGLFARDVMPSAVATVDGKASGNGIFNSYGMMIQCCPSDEDVVLDINFDTGAIPYHQCQRFARQLGHILRQICASDPHDSPLCSSINMIDEEDLNEITQWNSHALNAATVPIMGLIDQIGNTNSHATAISAWDNELDYEQVKTDSDRFALFLASKGVKKDDVIPVCLEKSAWMAVVIIAILKAGAVALPLSATTDSNRAGNIVASLKPRLAITSPTTIAFNGLIDTIALAEIISCKSQSSEHALPEVSMSDPALIIFTSGTTGNAKSILWNHSTLTSNAYGAINSFAMSAKSRVFQFSAYDFDVSHVETFAVLAAGGCLCVPSENDRLNRLSSAISEKRANWMCLTPSVSETLAPESVGSLRTLVFAGEKLKQETAFRWLNGTTNVFNWYGPAEASVATSWAVEKDTWVSGVIGKSTNGRTWLANPRDCESLAPIGAIAELCVEGPIVADGYINQPEIKSFFYPKWLRSDSERTRRVYRTGDRVRYDSGGNLVYLGRNQDSFRKIRGQRVRLDEIEYQAQTFLSKHLQLRVVAEIFAPDGSGKELLALFVAPGSSVHLDDEDVVSFMRRRIPVEALEAKLMESLPAFMVPRTYVPVAKLPITATGKTDRRLLRNYGSSLNQEQLLVMQPARRELREPSTDMERLLQQLWSQVTGLKTSSIHANDHFLRLSDSIGAMRLVALARDHDLQLTTADVFEFPELSEMAKVACRGPASSTEVVPPFSLLKIDGTERDYQSVAAERCHVPRADVVDMYPCTALQQGLLAMTARRSGQYVSRSVLEIQEMIDPARLNTAWENTVERLPILRTRIIDDETHGLVQVVLKSLPMRTGIALDQYLIDDETEPMGLGTELCRAAIIGNSFILTIHHALYDGSSLRMMLDEFEERYLGRPNASITPYPSFIRYLQTVDPQSAISYWKDELSNPELQQFPSLPTPNYEPKANENFTYPIAVDWPRRGVTPSTIIRSAWAILSARYTASDNVIFGATVSGRQANVAGIDKCVAPTVSTVPIAVSIDWQENVRRFQQRMQRQTVKMTPFEQHGLQRIQSAIGKPQTALFQSLLVVQPLAEGKSLQADSLLFKARTFSSNIDTRGTDPFNTYAMMLICELTASGFQLNISFDSSIIAADQTSRLAKQFELVVQQMCAEDNETTRLGEIQSAATEDLEYYWTENGSPPHSPTNLVHDLIMNIATQQPNEIAVDAWDGCFTYQQIEELSTTLAHNMIGLGVSPGSIVLLSLEKSKWTPVLELGTLQAGGVCMLQSESVPEARLSSIIKSVSPVFAMASGTHRELLKKHIRCFTVDEVIVQHPSFSLSANLPVATMSDPAAILVSSGSTGEPKKILWSHETLAANVQAFTHLTRLNKSSRLFQFTSHDFDVCTMEMMSTLAIGARLCVPSEIDRTNNLAGSIESFGCTFCFLTPSTAKLLEPKQLKTLKTIALGGENLTQEQANRWQGHCDIINWYGPCECPTATFCPVIQDQWRSGVIGKGNSTLSTRCWLVYPDNHNVLAPRGSIAEIALEGPGRAQGYLGNAELTDRFVRSPRFLTEGHGSNFPGRKGQVYFTGDLARLDSDGNIVCLGRKDAQVKVRGQIVAPEEVEQHIRRILSPKGNYEVVVEIVSPVDVENDILAAFIISNSKAATDFEQELQNLTLGLNEELEGFLPVFSIPSLYIPICELPMTSTGKADRKKLRSIGASFRPPRASNTALQEPTTTAERTLRELWAAVLRVESEKISRNDSFLRIGDSIQAMRLVSLAKQQGFLITVAQIFKSPRLKDMAKSLKNDTDHHESTIAPFSLMHSHNNDDQACEIAGRLCGIDQKEVEDIFPCTQLQQGLLALTMKTPGSYVGRNVLTLAESVNTTQFKAAWDKVVAAIPIFRTRIIDFPGQGLMQVVLRKGSRWSSSQTLQDFIQDDERDSIVLGSPLVRYGLVKDSGIEVGAQPVLKFALTMHHAAYDGATMVLILEALEHHYREEPPLALIPYQSFIKHIYQQSKDLETGFWKAQFDGLQAAQFPALPSDGYQPNAKSLFTHTMEDVTWRSDNFTPATMVRAAWSLLCSSYTNSSDVLFGTITSGRKAALPGIERVVGPTISALPIRIQIDYNKAISEFLGAVQNQATDMIPFEQTGIQQIRRVSEEAKQAGDFQSMLVIQPEEVHMDQSSCFVADPAQSQARAQSYGSFNTYALLAVCTLGRGELKVELSFDSNVVSEEIASRMAQQFTHVLTELCSSDLTTCVADINIASVQDLNQIWEWNHKLPQTVDACFHDQFSEIASQRSDATAVSAWDGELTYAKLDQLSTSVAHRLSPYKITRNMVVPICFEKSLWMTVAYLGVLKAGGCVLVLDDTQPESRLQTIVQQTASTVILSSIQNQGLASRLHEQVFTLGHGIDIEPASDNHTEGLPHTKPSDLLYAIFTSGSTGVPKGCLVSHGNFCSALAHQTKRVFGLGPTSRMYDFSAYSFDSVHWCIMHTFYAGGTLCIPTDEQRRNNLVESIREFRATDVFFTPTTVRMLDPASLPSLRTIFIGGEEVTQDDVLPWMPSTTMINSYGPAECSAGTSYWRIPYPPPETISIGNGNGSPTWIVDPLSNQRLAPVGTVGELWIEGPLVGQGYLNDPEKTAATIVDTPGWLTKGSPDGKFRGRTGRIYKSGDLVRYDPMSGNMVFVGRKDTQVKLRGQRIELSEVEHHVRQCLKDKDGIAAIIAEVIIPKATGRAILAVFLHIDSGLKDTIRNWAREFEPVLRSNLPSYMVPSVYLPIEALPLTGTGKTDRKRLRQIGADAPLDELTDTSDSAVLSPPSTEPELQLLRLWTAVLGVSREKIGLESSFFRLNGDSIAAMRMSGLARQQQLSLTVMQILKSPVFSEMAKHIHPLNAIEEQTIVKEHDVRPFSLLKQPAKQQETIAQAAQQCGVSISAVQDIFPCTAVQKSLLAVTSKRPGDYIARMALELREDVDVARLKQAWMTVSKTSAPILRNRIVHIPSEGLVQAQLDLPIEWHEYESVEAFIEKDKTRSMGLSEALTALAIAKNRDTGKVCCILIQHHAIYDGASVNLLLEEVSRVYAGVPDDRPLAHFQSFIKFSMNIDQKETRDFWTREFAQCESIAFPVLPTQDYQPKADSTVRCDIGNLSWPDRDVTQSTVLRTAWAILSACYTDSNDVSFGVLTTGRQVPVNGIERMIAPLIAALPVRIKFNPEQTVEELLNQIQQQSIEMIAYEQTELLEIRKINADTERGSHFNSLLIVQPPQPDSALSSDDKLFRGNSELRSSETGLDTFNPHAVMIMCQLRADNGLDVEINFDSNIMPKAQMERLVRQFEHVVRQICASTSHKIEDVNLLSQSDLQQLWTWNADVPAPADVCVHELIRTAASQHPDAPAICSHDGNLTYHELDELSDRLASYLVSLGAGPGDVIPMCFEKSLWMPVAALSAMKAGAAAVSMDSTQPEGRLRSIVSQIKPRFILSSTTHEDLARRISGATVVISGDKHIPASMGSQLPTVSPSDVLYLVFTSGSTGTPKGIITTHNNFSSAALHQADILHVKQGTRVFDFVSYSFDVAWSNLLNTLIRGGCLCIPSEWERRNDIPGALNRMNADYVYFTPSVARSLEPSDMPGIRTLAMGGEAIQDADVTRWTQAETVIGIYGPAECAQALSFVKFASKNRNNHVGHSYGARTWLVKPDCPSQLAAIGTVGELMIEGPTVSQRYWNDPDKTKVAYLPAPEWLLQGAPGFVGRKNILYKTGDLLRYNQDGSMDFVGRKDGMIKLRGQRVELTEVEHHVRAQLADLTMCDTLAAEIIVPKGSQVPILAIFVSFSASCLKDASKTTQRRLAKLLDGLEDRLSEQVPRYMMPGLYIPVDKIPMTTTNKTDRRALREVGAQMTLEGLAKLQLQGVKLTPPSTDTEKRLQVLWSSVLGVKASNIGSESSFMKIGGESISAMRLVAAARQAGLHFTVADIFKNPRLSQLARIATETKSEEQSVKPRIPFSLIEASNGNSFIQENVKPLVDSNLGEIEDVVPATDFQTRAVLDALQDPPSRYPHWILDLPAHVDFKQLQHSCEKLIEYYDILRSVFVRIDGRFLQVIMRSFKPTFDLIDAADGASSEFINTLCETDLKRERRLGSSFVRFMAVRSSDGQHKLIFRLSHAQFDGFSFGSVLNTLSSIHLGEASPAPSAFGDVIYFNTSKRAESLSYWKSRLNESTFPSWSLNSNAPTTFSPEDRMVIERTIAMPQVQTEGVSHATLFHAACALVLGAYYNQQEIVFGRLVTGRSMLPTNLQDVVGPILTEVPIRVQLNGNDTLQSVSIKLKDQFIEDSKHEAAGMVEIIRHSTEWAAECEDFGWRTSFQQGDEDEFSFLGTPSKFAFYEGAMLPRMRPEIYATPQGDKLLLQFEGNRKLIDEATVMEIFGRLEVVLKAD